MSNVVKIEAVNIPEETRENGTLVIKNTCYAKLITDDKLEFVVPIVSVRKLLDEEEPEQVKVPEKKKPRQTAEDEEPDEEIDDDFDEEFEDEEETPKKKSRF